MSFPHEPMPHPSPNVIPASSQPSKPLGMNTHSYTRFESHEVQLLSSQASCIAQSSQHPVSHTHESHPTKTPHVRLHRSAKDPSPCLPRMSCRPYPYPNIQTSPCKAYTSLNSRQYSNRMSPTYYLPLVHPKSSPSAAASPSSRHASSTVLVRIPTAVGATQCATTQPQHFHPLTDMSARRSTMEIPGA